MQISIFFTDASVGIETETSEAISVSNSKEFLKLLVANKRDRCVVWHNKEAAEKQKINVIRHFKTKVWPVTFFVKTAIIMLIKSPFFRGGLKECIELTIHSMLNTMRNIES